MRLHYLEHLGFFGSADKWCVIEKWYVYVCMCVYVCIYVCMYVCLYIYIYIRIVLKYSVEF